MKQIIRDRHLTPEEAANDDEVRRQVSRDYPFRPTTRGQLRNKLAKGIQCEVVASVAEMTAIMLRGWLNFQDFTVHPSKNDGWVIFAPETSPAKPATLNT